MTKEDAFIMMHDHPLTFRDDIGILLFFFVGMTAFIVIAGALVDYVILPWLARRERNKRLPRGERRPMATICTSTEDPNNERFTGSRYMPDALKEQMDSEYQDACDRG